MFRDLKTIPKFPFPIVLEPVETEYKIQKDKLEEEYWQSRRAEFLKRSTKSLIQELRDIRYKGHSYSFVTEEDIVAELAKRPHQRNNKERKEFVKKQQKRTERKTRGAR